MYRFAYYARWQDWNNTFPTFGLPVVFADWNTSTTVMAPPIPLAPNTTNSEQILFVCFIKDMAGDVAYVWKNVTVTVNTNQTQINQELQKAANASNGEVHHAQALDNANVVAQSINPNKPNNEEIQDVNNVINQLSTAFQNDEKNGEFTPDP